MVSQKGVQMSISRKIISFIIALGFFSISFAPAPAYTETRTNPAPKAGTGTAILVLANRTFGAVDVVLTGKTTSGNTVSYNYTLSEGQTKYQLEPGKYTGIFHGCNNLDGKKVFDLRGVSKMVVKLCCPSQNKPPHKIWIKIK